MNTPESNEKRKQTSLKNYGTEFPFQAEEVKQRIKKTNVSRYGAEYTLQSDSLREKIRITNLEKYGTEWPMQNEEYREKFNETIFKKYGVENVSQLESVKKKISDKVSEGINSGRISYSKISKLNRAFAELITEQTGLDVSFEKPFGSGMSADLEVDGLLVDINPTVSHNSHKSFWCVVSSCKEDCGHTPIARDYHYKRAVAALNDDVTLLQWFDWDSEADLVKTVRNKSLPVSRKYSARKLEVRVIPSRDANKFFEEFHIQGAGRGQTVCYALFDGNEIVAAASFGKGRFKSKYEWEFIRYAVRDMNVVFGGAGKLFDVFVQEFAPSNVVSYVDFSHTTKQQTFLNSIGFVEGKHTGPGLVWYRAGDGKRVMNTSLLSIGADRLLGTSYGSREVSGLDNTGIMLVEGFLPVYTAGNRVFVWGDL